MLFYNLELDARLKVNSSKNEEVVNAEKDDIFQDFDKEELDFPLENDVVSNKVADDNIEIKYNEPKDIFEFLEGYNEKLLDDSCYISFRNDTKYTEFYICIKESDDINKLVNEFLSKSKIVGNIKKLKEVSFVSFFKCLCTSSKQDNVSDSYIAYRLGLDLLYDDYGPVSNMYRDKIVDDIKDCSEIEKDIKVCHLGEKFKEEYYRICSTSKGKDFGKFVGHPAHYILSSVNDTFRRDIIRNLIETLYQNNRLLSRRYTLVSLNDYVNYKFIEDMYRINSGATIVLRLDNKEKSDEFVSRGYDIGKVCEIAKRNCDKTLTIISMENTSSKFTEKIYNYFLGMTMVTFTEDTYFKSSAVEILKEFASKDQFDCTDLYDKVMNSDRNYDLSQLESLYSKWCHEYLCNTMFPQYKQYMTQEQIAVEAKSESRIQLDNMIGMENIKGVLKDIINYFKLQKEYNKRDIPFKRPAMHMVFTSNPGCGKTTAARLIAQILHEEGVLSVGKNIEVGRSDIIGEFVGQTAPLVKKTFERAKGSVLFIDEAYSLVDDRRGLYGDEAINTIVQEMENNRDDTLVIFAGYKREMEEFLNRNPGLNSRISFHIDFNDYSAKELLEITESMARDNKFTISDSAKDKLIKIFEQAMKCPSFGNGRFARNLFEQAKLHQTSRIVQKDLNFITDEELTTLEPEDFEYEFEVSKPEKKFGFVA